MISRVLYTCVLDDGGEFNQSNICSLSGRIPFRMDVNFVPLVTFLIHRWHDFYSKENINADEFLSFFVYERK
jgi:hypothetical protein